MEVISTGGIHGLGVGGVAVTADRHATASNISRPCKGWLSIDMLHGLEQAVLAAKPSRWRALYARPENPTGCCDQIRWALTLGWIEGDGTEQSFMAAWYDETLSLLPEDLRTVRDAAMKIREALLSGCQN